MAIEGNDPRKQYYDYLKGAGADVPPTFESFSATLENEKNAKTYYEYLRKEGFDAPDSFESFSKTLGVKKKEPSQQYSRGLPPGFGKFLQGNTSLESPSEKPKSKSVGSPTPVDENFVYAGEGDEPVTPPISTFKQDQQKDWQELHDKRLKSEAEQRIVMKRIEQNLIARDPILLDLKATDQKNKQQEYENYIASQPQAIKVKTKDEYEANERVKTHDIEYQKYKQFLKNPTETTVNTQKVNEQGEYVTETITFDEWKERTNFQKNVPDSPYKRAVLNFFPENERRGLEDDLYRYMLDNPAITDRADAGVIPNELERANIIRAATYPMLNEKIQTIADLEAVGADKIVEQIGVYSTRLSTQKNDMDNLAVKIKSNPLYSSVVQQKPVDKNNPQYKELEADIKAYEQAIASFKEEATSYQQFMADGDNASIYEMYMKTGQEASKLQNTVENRLDAMAGDKYYQQKQKEMDESGSTFTNLYRTALNSITKAVSDGLQFSASLAEDIGETAGWETEVSRRFQSIIDGATDYYTKQTKTPEKLGDVERFFTDVSGQTGMLLSMAVMGRSLYTKTIQQFGAGTRVAGGLLKAEQLAAMKASIIPAYIISYKEYSDQAKELGFTGVNALAYAQMGALVEGVSEMIFPEYKAFAGTMKGKILKDLIREKVTDPNVAIKEFVKRVVKESAKSGAEEVVVDLFAPINEYVNNVIAGNADSFNFPEFGKLAYTFAVGAAIGAPLTAIGAAGDVAYSKKVDYEAAQNYNDTKDIVMGMVSEGLYTHAEAITYIEKINRYANQLANIDENLSDEKRAAILPLQAEISELQTANKNPDMADALKKRNEAKIQKLNNEIGVILTNVNFDKEFNEQIASEILQQEPLTTQEETQDAIQEQETAGVLQREPQEAGITGSERGGMEPIVEGEETTQERNDSGSKMAQDKISKSPNFQEVSESSNAYSGAPIVNSRGEVIQGNNRSIGLKKHYTGGKTVYKSQLLENAEKYGFTREDVEGMKSPILVRKLSVSDQDAVELGNYDVKDIETGGKQRISAQNVIRRMSAVDKERLSKIVFSGDSTPKENIRADQKAIAAIMVDYINPAQYNNLFKGNAITADGMNDIENIANQFLFENGSVTLPEIFEQLPHVIQAGLKKSIRYLSGQNSILSDLQTALMGVYDFKNSGIDDFNLWVSQSDMFKGGAPVDIFTPLEIQLMQELLNAKKESDIIKVFAEYNELTSIKEADFFSEATPGLTKAEAVKKQFNIDYNEANKTNIASEGESGNKKTIIQEETTKEEVKEVVSDEEKTEAKKTEKADVLGKKKEALSEAIAKMKEKHSDLNSENLGISFDPKRDAKKLYDYHKSLVDVAVKAIDLGIASAQEFATELGKKLDAFTRRAWEDAVAISNGLEPQVKGQEFFEDSKTAAFTAMKNEETKNIREAYGFDVPSGIAAMGDKALIAEAKKILDKQEYNVFGLMDRAIDGEAITPLEQAIIGQYMTRLLVDIERLDTAIQNYDSADNVEKYVNDSNSRNFALNSLEKATRALQGIGTMASASMRIRRMLLLQDFSLPSMMDRVIKAKGNLPLSDTERETINEEYNEIKAKEKAYQEHIEKLEQELKDVKLEAAIKELEKERNKSYTQRKRAVNKEQLKARNTELLDRLNEISKEQRQSLGSLDPRTVLLPETWKIIRELAKNNFLLGAITAAEVVDATYEQIKNVFPALSRQDVQDIISGYTADPRPTKKDMLADYKSIQTELRLQKILDNLEKGITPNKPISQAKSDRLKGLRRQIDQLQKERKIGRYSDEARIEAAEKAAQKALDNLEQRLRDNDLEVKEAAKVNSPRLKAIQDAGKALRKELEEKRKAAKIGRYSDEGRLASKKKSLEKAAKDLKEKMDKGDFAPETRERVVLDKEGRELLKEYNDAKYKFRFKAEKMRLERRGSVIKALDHIINVIGIPRALMATADFSAVLRQGLFFLTRVNRSAPAFIKMVQDAASAKKQQEWLRTIYDSPAYELMDEAGLYIADQTNPEIAAREEEWSSNLVSRIGELSRLPIVRNIPIVRSVPKIIGFAPKASERAYAGFLNRLRVSVWEHGVRQLQNEGLTPENNIIAYKSLATYINAATGRGPLGFTVKGKKYGLEDAAAVLNAVFFSPRLMASRIYLLTGGPLASSAMGRNKTVAKMYIRDLIGTMIFGATILALSKLIKGAEVDDDPTSSDFGKIKIGDVRLDVWGGFQQFVVLASRLGKGKIKNSITGDVKEINSPDYGSETSGGLLGRFARGKLSPAAGMAFDRLQRSDMFGRPWDTQDQLYRHFLPLVITEWIEMEQELGGGKSVPLGIGMTFGFGAQIYNAHEFFQKGVDDDVIELMNKFKEVAYDPTERRVNIFDPETGEEERISKTKYKTYYENWGDYMRQILREEYPKTGDNTRTKYTDMERNDFRKEFDKIKRKAKEYAYLQTMGYPKDVNILKYSFKSRVNPRNSFSETYELTPEQTKQRIEMIKAYMEEKKSNIDGKGIYKSEALNRYDDMEFYMKEAMRRSGDLIYSQNRENGKSTLTVKPYKK